jgi:hypothetical protein
LSTQVGTVLVNGDYGTLRNKFISPIYNLGTNSGEIARLGFFVFGFDIEGTVSLEPGKYDAHSFSAHYKQHFSGRRSIVDDLGHTRRSGS